MVMQEAQLDAPETSTTEHPRSRKLIGIIAGAAVLVILVTTGVYFMAFRSLPTTVSWAPSVSAIAPGGELTVAGRVTPAESGRTVLLESALSAQGPWQPMPQTATTDSRGQFTVTFKTPITASIVMRVVVDPAGRYIAATGKSMPVRLLVLSSINLKGGGTIPTNTALSFTATVDPIGASRTVMIEQSSDKVRWVPVGTPTQTKTDGTSVVKVPAPGVGAWSYRATVANDDKYAAAVSPVVGATIEDIKAAAATYLRITKAWNAANDSFKRSATNTSDPVVPGRWRSAARVLSSASTTAAADLKAYGPWPQAVRPLIDQIIAQYVIDADNDHQRSAATSFETWNNIGWASEGSRLSTLIRQALGLPQRAID